MEHAVDSARPTWLRYLSRGRGDSVRLLCFPHAGGAAVFFARLANELRGSVDVVSVQYPGRADRGSEPPVGQLVEVADEVVAELAPAWWDAGPVALLGHSMGALVAYEVARRLDADGRSPVRLFVSGRDAPTVRRREHAHLLDDASLIRHVVELGGADERLFEGELAQLFLPAIRADYRALAAYAHTPGPPLSCPVTSLNGTRDTHVTAAGVAAWRELTSGSFRGVDLPGGHFYLADRAPQVAAVVAGSLGVGVVPPRET